MALRSSNSDVTACSMYRVPTGRLQPRNAALTRGSRTRRANPSIVAVDKCREAIVMASAWDSEQRLNSQLRRQKSLLIFTCLTSSPTEEEASRQHPIRSRYPFVRSRGIRHGRHGLGRPRARASTTRQRRATCCIRRLTRAIRRCQAYSRCRGEPTLTGEPALVAYECDGSATAD